MIDTILAVCSIYLFIALGFFAKKSFKEKIDQKGLVLLSVYFLQPFLVFWGLNTKDFDFSLLKAPGLYLLISAVMIIVSYITATMLFKDNKNRSIATISSVIGNTGNLGIPLGVALFGEASVIYTSLINVANIFLIYSVGVFFYSRGEYEVKESFKNVAKLPALWFAAIALVYSYLDLPISDDMMRVLSMGAYAAMVLQLMIFGIYLYTIKIKEIDIKLMTVVNVLKFAVVPALGIWGLSLFDLTSIEFSVILLELIVPLAVTNVNLSALYNCKPEQVTAAVLITSLVFLVYLPFFTRVFDR